MLNSKKLAAFISVAFVYTANCAVAVETRGISSSATPYLVAAASGVEITSLLTVGDTVNNKPDGTPYRMVGIPDGLGAFDNNDGTFTVLMNHELRNTVGVARAHGGMGAFVSKWTINKSDLRVLHGEDLMKQVYLWDAQTGTWVATANSTFSRFCSADLPKVSAFYNKASKLGYQERIFMGGEENGTEGRAVAHIATGPNAGTSYELPALGKFSWENAVANPHSQNKTVVMGTDDGQNGQVYVYIGMKQASGNPVEQAGLRHGKLYGVKVNEVLDESRSSVIATTTFSLVDQGDVSSLSGAALDAASETAGVTSFLRPEDGAWDSKNPNVFYFVTTDRYDQTKDGVGTQEGHSRLYRLTFNDIEQAELGGTIETVIDGTGPTQMMDNITVNQKGNVLMQEDVGGQFHNGKIWELETKAGILTLLAQHDPARFGEIGVAATAPFNNDEESSGIIEISDLLQGTKWHQGGYRYYLANVQAHYGISGELVEDGQLLLLAVPDKSEFKDQHDDAGE